MRYADFGGARIGCRVFLFAAVDDSCGGDSAGEVVLWESCDMDCGGDGYDGCFCCFAFLFADCCLCSVYCMETKMKKGGKKGIDEQVWRNGMLALIRVNLTIHKT